MIGPRRPRQQRDLLQRCRRRRTLMNGCLRTKPVKHSDACRGSGGSLPEALQIARNDACRGAPRLRMPSQQGQWRDCGNERAHSHRQASGRHRLRAGVVGFLRGQGCGWPAARRHRRSRRRARAAAWRRRGFHGRAQFGPGDRRRGIRRGRRRLQCRSTTSARCASPSARTIV